MKTNATFVFFFYIEFCASDSFHTNVTPVIVQILGRISWNAVYGYVCGDYVVLQVISKLLPLLASAVPRRRWCLPQLLPPTAKFLLQTNNVTDNKFLLFLSLHLLYCHF